LFLGIFIEVVDQPTLSHGGGLNVLLSRKQ